jgi:hypothetical protein
MPVTNGRRMASAFIKHCIFQWGAPPTPPSHSTHNVVGSQIIDSTLELVIAFAEITNHHFLIFRLVHFEIVNFLISHTVSP